MQWRRGTADVSEEITNITFAAFTAYSSRLYSYGMTEKILLLFTLTGRVLSPSSPPFVSGRNEASVIKKKPSLIRARLHYGRFKCVCAQGGGGEGQLREPLSWTAFSFWGWNGGVMAGEGWWGAQGMIKAQVKSLIELSFRLISLLPLLA